MLKAELQIWEVNPQSSYLGRWSVLMNIILANGMANCHSGISLHDPYPIPFLSLNLSLNLELNLFSLAWASTSACSYIMSAKLLSTRRK
jgi:hypothetical protein